MKLTLKEIDVISYAVEIMSLFKEVFSAPPWNEDWSDDDQLDNYLKDLTEVRNPLLYGLYEGNDLVGVSIGRIKHWCEGTEYFIEELCIRMDRQKKGYGKEFFSLIEKDLKEKGLDTIFLMTDRDKPAYEFYKKNGFKEIPELTSFIKSF